MKAVRKADHLGGAVKLLLFVAIVCFGASHSAAAERPVLKVLNWSAFIQLEDSISEDVPIEQRSPVLRQFSELNDCDIEYTQYDDPAELTGLISSLPNYFDVIITGRKQAIDLRSIGLAEDFDFSKLPNYRYIDSRSVKRIGDSLSDYSIPYLLGTTGIAYRKDLVDGGVSSWLDFFEPPSSLKGKLALTADKQLAFSLSLLSLGHHFQSQDEEQMRNAAIRINRLNQAGFFGIVSSNVELVEQSLQNGNVAMAIMYSGDALSAMDKNPNIGYVVPEEGSEGYTDLICVNPKSEERDLAYLFIDYLMNPEIAAENSIYLKYATPNIAAIDIIRSKMPDLLTNPAVYTPESVEGKLHEIEGSTETVTRYWSQIFR